MIVMKLDKTKRKTSNSKRIRINPLMIEPEMIASKEVINNPAMDEVEEDASKNKP